MDKWSAFSWAMMVLSVAGTFIIAQARTEWHVYGFWLWSVANVGWIVINIRAEIPAQVALFAIYLGLSFYGIWERRGKHV
mgnify:CR=1 FL=1